jgi:hypothetical protein
MVWGIITLFIFLVLFPIIITSFATLSTAMTAGNYTGAGIVTIIPLILEVGGVFGSSLLVGEGATGKRVFKSRGGHKGKKGKRN